MKIELHDMSEVYDFASLVTDARNWRRRLDGYPANVDAHEAEVKSRLVAEGKIVDRQPEVPEVAASVETADTVTWSGPGKPTLEPSPSLPEEAAAPPELDADGRRHDERIDSSSKALTAKGVWRARRNHGLSDEEVEAIKREGTVAPPEPETEDAPAVTETHPLPVDEPEAETEVKPEPEHEADNALKVEFFELVEQARKPAEDIQKDDIATTLQAAQAFTKAHSPHTFRLLRETITDKTLPGMTPGERRVLLAAMELYKP